MNKKIRKIKTINEEALRRLEVFVKKGDIFIVMYIMRGMKECLSREKYDFHKLKGSNLRVAPFFLGSFCGLSFFVVFFCEIYIYLI